MALCEVALSDSPDLVGGWGKEVWDGILHPLQILQESNYPFLWEFFREVNYT